MAAIVGHVFLAAQALAVMFPGRFNEREFIRGTSFPDIRYLNLIKRNKTHVDTVSLDDVRNARSSFHAGLLFHSWVDLELERFVVANKMYDDLPRFCFISQSLKFAEDEILRQSFDVTRYVTFLEGDLLAEERTYGIADATIYKWYAFLQRALLKKISYRELAFLCLNVSQPSLSRLVQWFFGHWYAWQIQRTVNKVLHSERLSYLIREFYDKALGAASLSTVHSDKGCGSS